MSRLKSLKTGKISSEWEEFIGSKRLLVTFWHFLTNRVPFNSMDIPKIWYYIMDCAWIFRYDKSHALQCICVFRYIA